MLSEHKDCQRKKVNEMSSEEFQFDKLEKDLNDQLKYIFHIFHFLFKEKQKN